MSIPMPHWRFSVAAYEQMIETGILTEDDRVELIRGEIVDMCPIGGRHVDCVGTLTHLLVGQVGNAIRVHVQSPIRLPDDSEPVSDFSLIRPGYVRQTVPDASDVAVVIEVSDTSRDYDRNTKLPLYAAAGIPEAWLFDLVSNRIERHTQPGPDGYRLIALAGRGESLTSTVLPTVTLSIDDVLPPQE